jgi:hypothetical protein
MRLCLLLAPNREKFLGRNPTFVVHLQETLEVGKGNIPEVKEGGENLTLQVYLLSCRQPGDNLRKISSGDWNNHCPREN